MSIAPPQEGRGAGHEHDHHDHEHHDHGHRVKGYGTRDAASRLEPVEFDRHHLREHDVDIEILFCGVCHSDIHQARDEWHNTVWPCVPGHEIVGRVRDVGEHVSRFEPGDLVGVGCMINSCQQCSACAAGDEQYCEGPNSWLATYNGPMIPNGSNTFGGYSTGIVVTERFVLRIPDGLDPALAAPLLCAGVTTYSPMKHWKIGKGHKVGIVGIGGLGHVAIQLATKRGAEVTAFTSHPEKAEDAKRFGAVDVVNSNDAGAMKQRENSLDFILSTIPVGHDVNPYVETLKRDGTIVLVGALEPLKPTNHQLFAFKRKSLGGSLIGSLEETQEILDFCAENGVAPQIQKIPIDQVNDAFDSVVDAKARYRYVIDLASGP